MRLWASLGLIAGIGWMSGCGPVAPRVVDAKYRKASLDGRLLRVMPIHSLDVHNMDDFRDDFGGGGGAEDPGTVLSDLFGEAIFSLVDRAEVLYDDVPIADSQFQDTVLSVPAKQEVRAVTFRFPSDSALRERTVDPDMVLQIVDLQVHRDWRPGGGAGGTWSPLFRGWAGRDALDEQHQVPHPTKTGPQVRSLRRDLEMKSAPSRARFLFRLGEWRR